VSKKDKTSTESHLVIKYYMNKKREKEFDRGVYLRQTLVWHCV